MNWTRYKLLIISGGVTVVLSSALLFWILSVRSENADVKSEIQSLTSKQASLKSQPLFPSEQNFQLLKAEQEKVVAQRDQLKDLIAEGELKVQEVSRSNFSGYIKSWASSLRKTASESVTGGEHGVILVDPDFGFTDYIRNGILPVNSELPNLLLELQTMEVLCNLLFESGISELISVSVVEEKSAVTPGRNAFNSSSFSAPGMNAMNNIPGGSGAMPPGAGMNEEGAPSEKERMFTYKDYRVEYRVYEDYLWTTLNNFMGNPNTLVVKELGVTNSNQELWPHYLKPLIGTKRNKTPIAGAPKRRPERRTNPLERMFMSEEGPAPEEPKEDIRIAGLTERRQNMVGGDLLNVYMVVRVYRLINEDSETEQGR
ncbi:Amuc_1100 family pilus-like protein [Kiritimatiellota bacterium B12222]|nr:Amuc_1100 family pilus-like protein [Kiritimatiellota bacterium B12222]